MSGYLNIRETPSTGSKIIGKLSGDGAYEILATEGDWSHITSGGGGRGYIRQPVPSDRGTKPGEKAKELVKLRPTVTADNLNIRQACPGSGKCYRTGFKGRSATWSGTGGQLDSR